MFDSRTAIELRDGNPVVFKEVFDLLYPRLKSYSKLFLDDNSFIDDLIQETFISFWNNRSKIRKETSIESYIFVSLRNRCLNHIKSQKLRKDYVDVDKLEVVESQYLYNLDMLGEEDRSMEELIFDSFQEAVDQLPVKMKQVFVLCKIENRKQKDVAEELGISLKMVEKHISGAKSKIRESLLAQYPLMTLLILLITE